MAKKKTTVVEETPVMDVQTNTEEISGEISLDVSTTESTPTVSEDVVAVEEIAKPTISKEEIENLKKEATDEINRCNAYVFSGRDIGLGRVFELSRREWCDYYIELEYCQMKGKEQLPKKPYRQKEPGF